jgi:exodeoxyribonuclease-3
VRLVSWNVNGIRAAIRNGLWAWLAADRPDILCLQETRIHASQLSVVDVPPEYHAFWHTAERKGYSGVATLCCQRPLTVWRGFGQTEYDDEGRVLVSEHNHWTLVNAYFPSGRRGQERVKYKIGFYDGLLEKCTDLRAQGHRLIICGDFNTAHQPIDLARPRENRNTSGFLPEERKALTHWHEEGFVDVFRRLHPTSEEYTWWTYRHNARARNIGWRLDCFLVSKELMPMIARARIMGDVMGSDHCPVELTVKT